MTIVRGTTPTIIFNFNDIATSEISVAILTIKQNGVRRVTNDTLNLRNAIPAEIFCDWKLNSGVRSVNVPTVVEVCDSGKDTVI